MLTNKGKYGLKAMVHLAGLEPGTVAQVADIAEANAISKKFLDHILTELRHGGLVYSKKGKDGGYGWLALRTRSESEQSCGYWTGRWRRSSARRSPLTGPATIAPAWGLARSD